MLHTQTKDLTNVGQDQQNIAQHGAMRSGFNEVIIKKFSDIFN